MAKWNWTGDRSFTGELPQNTVAKLETLWQEDQRGADQAPAEVFSQETEKERIVCR